MLVLWRRHARTCSDKDEGRDHQRCRCSIWMDWTNEGRRIRKPLGVRDWQIAQRRARDIEVEGLVANKSTVTVEKALADYETDLTRNRRLKPPTMRKYEYFLRTLREFCESQGLIFFAAN
jgi:hypothetical protein